MIWSAVIDVFYAWLLVSVAAGQPVRLDCWALRPACWVWGRTPSGHRSTIAGWSSERSP